MTAIQAAWAAITQTPIPRDDQGSGRFAADHFRFALQAAVHIGDDTDTVACIAGGLLGARWGVAAIPAEWRARVHGWPRLEHLSYPGARRPSEPVLHPYDDGVTLGTAYPLPHETDAVVTLCRIGTHQRHLPRVDPADHLVVWLLDSDNPDDNPHLDFVLADTARFIAARRDRGQRVFVHCVAAHQRTPSVALAYAALRGHDPRAAATSIGLAMPTARGRGRLWDAAAAVAADRPGVA